jgi:hypothetical protein
MAYIITARKSPKLEYLPVECTVQWMECVLDYVDRNNVSEMNQLFELLNYEIAKGDTYPQEEVSE